MRKSVVAPVVAVGLAVSGCGGEGAPEQGQDGHVIEVEMHDNFFVVEGQEPLGQKYARNTEEITFRVKNQGNVDHNLDVSNGHVASDVHGHGGDHEMPGLTLEPGEPGELTFEAEGVVISAACHEEGHDTMRFELDLATGQVTTPQQ